MIASEDPQRLHLWPPVKRHHLELTAEQRQAIETKVTEMKATEANRSEIKKAVGLMLQSFSVELIDSKVKDMREAGANRKKEGNK